MFDNIRASLQFWYAKHFIKMERDYTIAYDFARENSDHTSIKILRKYPGVIFELFDLKSDDDGEVSFETTVIFNPNNAGIDSERFKKYLDSIVRNILISAIEEHIKNNGVVNEDGNIDIVESDSERAVHEEGSSVYEKRVSDRKPRKKGVRGNKRVHPKV